MKSIMIVDDAMFMRSVISGILKDGGPYEILEAENGEAALRLYNEKKPDLTLMDITMPGIDGIEALRRLREADSGAKVVMCSAIGQEAQIMAAVKLGAIDYIVKPFKPENILRLVRAALSDGVAQ